MLVYFRAIRAYRVDEDLISAYSKDTDDRKGAYTLTGHTERSGIEVLFSILSGSIIIIINTQLYAFSGRGQLLCVTNLGNKELYV